MDLHCPSIPITAEERNKLYRSWRKTIIIKLLGRKICYRFLFGRLTKLWNLTGSFELIGLLIEFFLVRFYEHVLYDGPLMILGHYLTAEGGNLSSDRLKNPSKGLQLGFVSKLAEL